MDSCCAPPHARTGSLGPTTPRSVAQETQLATPNSLQWKSPKPATPIHDVHVPAAPIQTKASLNPETTRFQQDLLILTSFNDNSTLHWRPAWFSPGAPFNGMWTLHNPPNVVTERLSSVCQANQLFTRRMRRPYDPPPQYIKSWAHWERYCDLYGVPSDFLCEEQVQLLRVGLPRSPDGSLCTPPLYPLYPEPSGRESYILAPSQHSFLPRKFHHVTSASSHTEWGRGECIVVESDGTLSVESYEDCVVDHIPKRGSRWSYLPWTAEMERSCQPWTVRLRLWNEADKEKRDEGGDRREGKAEPLPKPPTS